jgi:hypothetical protein
MPRGATPNYAKLSFAYRYGVPMEVIHNKLYFTVEIDGTSKVCHQYYLDGGPFSPYAMQNIHNFSQEEINSLTRSQDFNHYINVNIVPAMGLTDPSSLNKNPSRISLSAYELRIDERDLHYNSTLARIRGLTSYARHLDVYA